MSKSSSKSLNNREVMKYENQQSILNLISKGNANRSQIANATNLTQAAVSIIVNELINNNIVVETIKSKDESSVGRKPIVLDINPDWGYTLGISIDRDGIDIGLVNIKGQIIDKFRRFPTTGNYSYCLDQIAEKAQELLSRNQGSKEKIIAVGVAVPGPIDLQAGKLLNPPGFFQEWYNLNIKKELEARFSYPIYIAHNGIAFAMAEKRFGIGSDFSNFLLFNINAGLGAGLVLNDTIYTNRIGLSCEIGHTSIDINGRLCSCGHRGCLETYASISAIMYDAKRLCPELDSWAQLVDAAYQGDPICRRFIQQEAEYLSHVIINISNLFGLDAVILTGEISYRPNLLINDIQKKANAVTLSKSYQTIQILSSAIHDSVHIISGAAIVINSLFDDPLFFQEIQKNAGYSENNE